MKEVVKFTGRCKTVVYDHIGKIRLMDETFAYDENGDTYFSTVELAAYKKMLETIDITRSILKGIVALFKTLGKYEYLNDK
ncbi:hypothetical protein E4L99_15110 [Lysinibacillus sp. S2017]|uniref:hypothetical protein n=1 Tax=Lysinibacillus sp. 2017 TaxID=2169540 RepID=UPI001091F418|nr:hypothetical protein [Lysinibacillus sp. 2017]TGN33168.1 hypothetical protein E4L99_15110 [Lysinibacillus sp. S2017]